MLTFTLAVFFLLITPGPAVLSVAGIGSAFGPLAGIRFIAGLFFGTNLVLGLVASGIAAIVLANEDLRFILLTISIGYLLYLASKIALAGSKIAFTEAQSPPGFWAGLILQTVNPKAYAVSTTLFSGFLFWPQNLIIETAFKLSLIHI